MLKRYKLLPACAVACSAVLLALSLLSQPGNAQQTSTSPATISLQPCEVPGAEPNVKEKALCATYDVFEDRVAKSGRKIALKILVFPATGKDKSNDPLFYIPGGPGSSATEDAPYIAQRARRYSRASRSGVCGPTRHRRFESPQLRFFQPVRFEKLLRLLLPARRRTKMSRAVGTEGRPRLYTTSIAMDDLDDVRKALGYEKINLLGGSYGTRAVQVYLKDHQSHVRAIVLHGVSPTKSIHATRFPRAH